MAETARNQASLAEDIAVTERAARRLQAVMASEGKADQALRLSVTGGGCSGMTYNMSFDTSPGEYDKIFKCNGVTIYCDLKSWLYLKGVQVDFSEDILTGGFQINNPNAVRTCGCGTSFAV